MEDSIKVTVIEYADRKHLLLGYRDPITGKLKTRSAKTADRKAAERAAAVWEAELRKGEYKPISKTTWEEFRERYESEVVTGLAKKTGNRVSCVFNIVEKLLKPARVRDITAERLSWLAAEMRKSQAESSIQSTMAHLKAALRWAEGIELIVKAPKFPKLQRAKGVAAKGRAITGEEFDRMLDAVPKLVKPADVAEWRRFLNGLYYSGFRIGEALALSWEPDSLLSVDLSADFPVVHIKPEGQKSHRAETLPIAPEFADLLQATPEAERRGKVFKPRSTFGRKAGAPIIMALVADIGERAGVKTWESSRNGKVKFATAHDLRRAFGLRWSTRVEAVVLQQMMRHSDINTTLKFYAGRNAQSAAAAIWKSVNATPSVNSSVNSADSSSVESR